MIKITPIINLLSAAIGLLSFRKKVGATPLSFAELILNKNWTVEDCLREIYINAPLNRFQREGLKDVLRLANHVKVSDTN